MLRKGGREEGVVNNAHVSLLWGLPPAKRQALDLVLSPPFPFNPLLPFMALLRPAAYQAPGMPGFAAGPDCHCSPGSHGNTLPLPSSPPSSQTRPGPNNAPSASQWPGHNAPVSVHCQPQEACWVSWPVWHIYITRASRGDFFLLLLFKNSMWAGVGWGREGSGFSSEYLNIL